MYREGRKFSQEKIEQSRFYRKRLLILYVSKHANMLIIQHNYICFSAYIFGTIQQIPFNVKENTGLEKQTRPWHFN